MTETNFSKVTSKRDSFYSESIAQWIPDKNATILVIGGGKTDRNVLFQLGYINVVISNFDFRVEGDSFSPYTWKFLDANNLKCEDGEFDYVIVNAALHHCASPHRALLEMYRVANKGLIFIESRDSIVMRVLEILHFTETYEITAVYYYEGKYGGVNYTHIPNFVYRWTEREIEKTIATYAPHARHRIFYRYGNDTPSVSTVMQNRLKYLLIFMAIPLYNVFIKLFPKQQNLFACKIEKPILPDDLLPWLRLDNTGEIQFNKDWAERVYKKK